MSAFEKLTKLYTLQASLTELEARKETLKQQLPELKQRQREASIAAAAGESPLQRLVNRLRGSTEDGQEALIRTARAAATALEQVQRDLSLLEQKLESTQAEFAALGTKQALMAQLTGPEQQHFLKIEAAQNAENALHFLRKCRNALCAAQELARNPMMRTGDGYRENSHKAEAGDYADKCRNALEVIRACGYEIAPHPYLENPMGYLVTAMRYGELDRMNSALSGLYDTEEALKALLLRLAD